MNAIINGCRPWLNQGTDDDCGPYLVDLSDNNAFPVGRSVQNMKVNSSCSYRAFSNCGYPEALFKVHDPVISADFDVAWAAGQNFEADEDYDMENFNYTSNFTGSAHSAMKREFYNISEVTINKKHLAIDDKQWTSCRGIYRNLYITVTRTQDSSKPAAEGLAQTARQLAAAPGPYNPGALSPAFEVTFKNVRGAANALVGAVGVVIAGLAVLAF